MIKFICDKCGKEDRKISQIRFRISDIDIPGTKLLDISNVAHLCEDCYDLYKRLNLDISGFMERPLDELNLLRSFKEV